MSRADRALARRALQRLKGWGLQPFDLDETATAVAAEFMRRLLLRRLLPEAESNDGLILAETALERIPLLASSDQHLLGMDEDALSIEFKEADLLPVRAVHPKRLLRALG